MMTWAEKIEAKGHEAGMKEGAMEGMKDLLLRQLEARFPGLPAAARVQIGAMTSTDELAALGERLAVARSLAELGLP